MSLDICLGLISGLSLFLYGMQMMSSGLEAAAGERLKSILERITSNPLLGIFMGALITAIIQSSSATTVMVVGFINAGMMNIFQAVWIIMGANIGTTITGQLIALDAGVMAPFLAIAGVATITFSKKSKLINYAKVIAGLGILFIGMDIMSTSMYPLRESAVFIELVTNFSNPLVGIMVGAIFTAIIQSSSASVGILQALALTGVVGLNSSVYVLFGQNIGTCITSVLASIGMNREAKQATLIHLIFNIFGTILFTILCMATPFVGYIESFTPNNPAAQIANMHTIFNIVTTIVLIPFGHRLAQLSEKLLPEKDNKKDANPIVQTNSHGFGVFGSTAINIQQVENRVLYMRQLAYDNVYDSFAQLKNYSEQTHENILFREKQVDDLDIEINELIANVLAEGRFNFNASEALNSYTLILVDLERISDYAISIEKQAKTYHNAEFSDEEIKFMEKMLNTIKEMKHCINDAELAGQKNRNYHECIHNWRLKEIDRLKDNKTTSELCVMFSRLFTYYERINDHALNVTQMFNRIDKNLHKFEFPEQLNSLS